MRRWDSGTKRGHGAPGRAGVRGADLKMCWAGSLPGLGMKVRARVMSGQLL